MSEIILWFVWFLVAGMIALAGARQGLSAAHVAILLFFGLSLMIYRLGQIHRAIQGRRRKK